MVGGLVYAQTGNVIRIESIFKFISHVRILNAYISYFFFFFSFFCLAMIEVSLRTDFDINRSLLDILHFNLIIIRQLLLLRRIFWPSGWTWLSHLFFISLALCSSLRFFVNLLTVLEVFRHFSNMVHFLAAELNTLKCSILSIILIRVFRSDSP